jgi:hypothetical protein
MPLSVRRVVFSPFLMKRQSSCRLLQKKKKTCNGAQNLKHALSDYEVMMGWMPFHKENHMFFIFLTFLFFHYRVVLQEKWVKLDTKLRGFALLGSHTALGCRGLMDYFLFFFVYWSVLCLFYYTVNTEILYFFQCGHTVIISVNMTMCQWTSHGCQIVSNAWLFTWMPNIFHREMKYREKATSGRFVLHLTFFNFSSVNPK